MKMKSKKGKNMLALLLAFAMIVTGIVVTPVNAVSYTHLTLPTN